jgi:outer membrane protein W
MTAARLAAACTAAVALAPAASAHAEPDRFYVRGGLLHVAPMSDSRELVLSDVRGPASLALMDGPVRGSGAAVDPMTMPAVIVGYLLPALGDRLAVETVLAPPLHLRFRATGTLANESIAPEALGIPTGVPALGPELGEADAAPPVVTVVYRWLARRAVHAYAGAGGTVLLTYNARATNPALTEAAEPRLHVEPAPGLVLQTGIDVRLWRGVRARVDIKYIAFLKAHATVENLRVRTPELPLFESVDVGTATMDLTVNPLVVHVGIGADFW